MSQKIQGRVTPKHLNMSELDIDKQLAIDIEVDKKQAEVENLRTLIQIKKDYAEKVFHYMRNVTYYIGLLLAVYIGHMIVLNEQIPETVIIALITTTLASAVGLVGFIVRGLFKASD